MPAFDSRSDGQWLLTWLSSDELAAATMNVIVTFEDVNGTWQPLTIACESLLVPGQYGLFAARDFSGGETVGVMRDGAIGTYRAGSDALRGEIQRLQANDGAHYLYVLPTSKAHTVTLHDGRFSRPGGPRNANDGRDTLPQNCRFMEDGQLLVRGFQDVARLRPDASQTRRLRAELLWDYGPDYWSVEWPPLQPPVGRRVAIWFRGDSGQPWGRGRVECADMNGTHRIRFDDGWVESFHLARELRDGQLRWDDEAPQHQRMDRA